MSGFEVMPLSVGEVSRGWDEQNGELTSAESTLDGADSSGFQPAVQGAARTFVRAWSRHAGSAAEDAEERADGLRETNSSYLSTDRQSGIRSQLLRSYLLGGRR